MYFNGTGYRYPASIFLRLLGFIYILAFYSLWTQIHGLIGADGILPVAAYFEAASRQLGAGGVWTLPSLMWMFHSDLALSLYCVVGLAAGLMLTLGFLPLPAALLAWLLYLSLTVGGQIFLGYQWDNLLLECGLLAILLAPPVWRSKPSLNPEPPITVVFLLHWLLFRLMFSAGYVKVAGGDTSWVDLTALDFHFWTQPLPAWTSWYFQQMPGRFLQVATAVVLFIELAVPFLIFTTRRLRVVAFGFFVFLQLIIWATGNYGFFNLLAMVLCIMLLDDSWFETDETFEPASLPGVFRTIQVWVGVPIVAVVLLTSITLMGRTLVREFPWPAPVDAVARAVMPFRSVNNYGLFAYMTKYRPEIILEGSRDGVEWRAYEFFYKPGNVFRAPGMVAPHMPRLDWQMWFASLGHYTANPWVTQLMQRLLAGSPDVLDLMEVNPFGSEPPRYIRAVLYHYTFATAEAKRERGVWWQRELKGLYTPVMSRPP